MKREPSKEHRIAGAIIKKLREATPREPLDPDEPHPQVRTDHVTQLDIAEQIPLDPSTLSKIERGELKIELHFIEQLSGILQLTPVRRYLLLAVSGRFPVAFTQFLGLASHIQDSFYELDLIEKNLGELEAMIQLELHKACHEGYQRLSSEIGAGDVVACLNSLYELNRLLNAGRRSPLELVLANVTVLITNAIPQSSCSIYLFDVSHKPHKLIMRAKSDSAWAHQLPSTMTLNDESPVGRAAKEGKPFLLTDPGGSHLIMPVLAFSQRHQLLGVISTFTTRTFAKDEEKFLECVSGLLATHYQAGNNFEHQTS